MKLSFRQNVWDNVSLFHGSKKIESSSLQRACGIQSLAEAAAKLVAVGSVVELPGHPALPVTDECDRLALTELVYTALAKCDIRPGHPLVLNVRPSRA